MLTVKGKSLGSKRPLFADFSVPLPPEMEAGQTRLRDLIEAVVRHEVDAFRQRQTDRQFIRVLTQSEIDQAEAAGKIESGGSEVGVQEVDVDQAIETAIQAFTDGMYLVVVDEQECRDLDAELFLNPESELTFIRLTLLAGG